MTTKLTADAKPRNQQKPRLTRWLTLLLALGAAISVANIYYCQPLLALMGQTFHETSTQMGFVATVTQFGYAAGLLFLTPLGDIWSKRSLIVILSFTTAITLFALSQAQTITWLEVASFLTGMWTIVPQVIIPLAVDLADEKTRGQVVGTVMGGLLLGILAARTFSGAIGQWFGWRTVYLIATGLMIALGVIMYFALPQLTATAKLTYGKLMRSIAQLFLQQPILRQSSMIGGSLFGAFSVLWTVLAFRLSQSPYHYGSAIVGLFGLVGIGGALIAPIAGRIADRRGPSFMIGVGIFITFASYVMMLLGDGVLLLLIFGVLLLDFGVQASQISNQARIYALVPEARSRVNSIYMVSYFLGGTLGSFLAAISYGLWQWTGACLTALMLVSFAGTIHLVKR
ncbi:MFS transporter [Sulfoacidibacillus thermotolerans]|uniref:Major facilitator superfamily (MFS) profile domain-containing protein n=1 Tax=Sulfoacidibacillus thermotolerans TaxID=1765684 RepID=A0A2U3DAT6_SULT2|nr:MFS transporter [Sulfoacidibacillus thermotolerans]PWI58389.1 hypothetical protein BM613_04025 [Sulfoacidibacillus thermotolerans]